jgi:FKBP-type peptidyl-prolyl cis-trans isomerase FkpA
MRITRIALSVSLGLGAAAVLAQQPALQTDQDKTLYALGEVIGRNVARSVADFHLTAEELAIVTAGLNDAVLGRDSKVDFDTYAPRIQELAEERAAAGAAAEKEASAAFLHEVAQEKGAQRSASGLVFVPIKEGTGPNPTATSIVQVHYHGTLRDGTVFDSSVERGEPISFPLDAVIPCWTEGVQKIKVGGKAKLACPSDLAYGDGGQGPIPGGAALVFEVELLAIE